MNYNELSNEELDRLAAERFYGLEKSNYSKKLEMYKLMDSDGGILMRFKDWRPTHPDSNQCERYLFPKMKKMKITCIYFDDGSGHVEVCRDTKCHAELECGFEEFDQINRTKTIAALMALDELQKG